MKLTYLYLICSLISIPAHGMRTLKSRPMRAASTILMRHMHINTAYQIMHATPYESLAVIQNKYRELAKLYHPDHNLRFHTAAAQKFQEIKEAFETISKAHRDPANPFVEDPELAKMAEKLRNAAHATWLQELEMREQDAGYEQWSKKEKERKEEAKRRYMRWLTGAGIGSSAIGAAWLAYYLQPVSSEEAIEKIQRDDLEKELSAKLGTQSENLQPVFQIKMAEYRKKIEAIEQSMRGCNAQQLLKLKADLDAVNEEGKEFLKHTEALEALKHKEKVTMSEVISLLNQGANPNKIFLWAVSKNNHELVEILVRAGADEDLREIAFYNAHTALMAYQLLKHGIEIQKPENLFLEIMSPRYDADLIPLYAAFLKAQKRPIQFKEYWIKNSRGEKKRKHLDNPWQKLAYRCDEYQDQNALMKKVDELYKIFPAGVNIPDNEKELPWQQAHHRAERMYNTKSAQCKCCKALAFVLEQLGNRQ
jgi:curved DNA-binding protein CbpA